MNKFKKKILKIYILATICASSVNCFAMENNNQENKKLSNNNFIYNSLNNTNLLNKKRTLIEPIIEDPQKKQTENINENKKSIIKSQKEKDDENKDVINNKIEESSIKENFESEEEESESDYELDDKDLLENIEIEKINLKNIINNINEEDNNIFIFFKLTFNIAYAAKLKINEAKIYKDFLCYLIDKEMDERQSWYSHLNTYLLKDLFEDNLKQDKNILGFCVSLKENFIFPNFIEPEKENAYNTLEKFIKSFENSKTKILKLCSEEKDILYLKKDEFSKIIDKILNLLECYIIIGDKKYWKGGYNYKNFKEETFKKIEDMGAKIIKGKDNLEEVMKEIHDHILNFLTINKENIANLKLYFSESSAKNLDNLNNKMLNIFKYSPEIKNRLNEFDNIKTKFKNFTNNFLEKNPEFENKEIFNKTIDSLTLKKFKELMKNIYSYVETLHVNKNSKLINYINLIFPIEYTFTFEFDIPEKSNYLFVKICDNIMEIIKDTINQNLYNEKCIFSSQHKEINDKTKTLKLKKIHLICLNDAFFTLFFDKNVVIWPFKNNVIDFQIIPTLKKEIPNIYANQLLNIYKKIIEDEKIDTKTLDVDKFLEKAKNYSLDKYIDKILQNDIYNINKSEENNFDTKLFNKIKERYINDNKNIFNYSISPSMYSFISFQIDFMVETFAKNLKNIYSEFIKEFLTKNKIKYDKKDYKLTAPDGGILKLVKNNPQEGYNFNFKLMLNDTLFKIKDYINKTLKYKKNKDSIINKAINYTTDELKEMSELSFYKKVINHFEKNKPNIKKYIEKKDPSDNNKNLICKNLKMLIDMAEKENYNLYYLENLKDTYICDIYFDIQKL